MRTETTLSAPFVFSTPAGKVNTDCSVEPCTVLMNVPLTQTEKAPAVPPDSAVRLMPVGAVLPAGTRNRPRYQMSPVWKP